MKEYDYVYKNKKGEIKFAVSGELLVQSLFLFWVLPFVAIFMFIWHRLTDNVILVSTKEYHMIKLKECSQK